MTLAAGIDLGTGAVKTALFDVSDGEVKWLASERTPDPAARPTGSRTTRL